MNTIEKRLKFLRDNKKITQQNLADAIKEKRDTLANWEIDRADPPISAVIAIADYFGVSTDFILGRNAEMVSEEGLLYGLDDEEKEIIAHQAEFLRYKKALPDNAGSGSSGLTDSGKNGNGFNSEKSKREKGA